MISLKRIFIASQLVFLLLASAISASAVHADEGPLAIARITPTGEDVPASRQIVIEFDRAVVPLGQMERDADEVPVAISPDLNCEWRWLNERALACQLKEADEMKASTRYHMTINPGLVALDGAELDSAVEHEFVTSRVRLDRATFNGWSGPSTPSLLVTFNQPVRRDSLVRNLSFVWSGNEDGSQGITASEGPEWSQAPDDAIVDVPREPGLKGFFKRLLAYIPFLRADDEPAPREWARRSWQVTPSSALPLDTNVKLVMQPGLVSGLGDEPSTADQTVKSFATFGEFRFLGMRCAANDGSTIIVRPGDENSEPCGPWNLVRLLFSAPVPLGQIRDHAELSPPLGKPSPDSTAWDGVDPDQTENFYDWKGHEKGEEFTARFPIYLRSDRDYTLGLKPESGPITDIFGRPLEGEFALAWRMDNRPPNFELPNEIAVLEKEIESDVPLYVNNLVSRDFSFSRLTTSGVQNGLKDHRKLDPIRNLQYAVPFGVRQMLEGRSGVLLGQLTTTPLTRKKSETVFAQVTPFSVHTKIAHYNSMVWVTDLATGEPVEGARVSFQRNPDLLMALCGNSNPVLNAPLTEDAFALTDKNGFASLPGQPREAGFWESPCDKALTVRVQKNDDLAILPVFYQFEVDTYRASGEQIWPNDQSAQEHMRVWGTTAQGVYRAGDTIQYKIYVRGQGNKHLTAAPSGDYRVQLIDPTGKPVDETRNVTLNEFGATSGEFKISNNGAVGWYRFRLLQKLHATDEEVEDYSTEEGSIGNGNWYAWKPMQVLVSDFTPASFRVTTSVNGDVFGAEAKVKVEGKATLHAGGPYTNAKARVTAMYDPAAMHSSHPVAAAFDFSNADEARDSGQRMIAQNEMSLDQNGIVESEIVIPDQGANVFGSLTFEVAVSDDRGKNIANAASAIFAATDRFVGLKSTAWIFQAGKSAAFEYIVVDPKGNPTDNSNVSLKIQRKKVTAARVKSAGSVYQTVYEESWEESATCQGKPVGKPETCNFTPEEAGEYRITAIVKGSNGKTHSASSDFWVTGPNVVLWESDPDTALKLFPEKPTYKVGDTARYLIKNPFPKAKALITIERYGVIDHFVQTFDTSTPILEFPVKPEYAPGFYVSVVLMSPRVDKPLEDNAVDLGKPAFRMGYVSVPVSDPYNELAITAKSEKDEYRPGDAVRVNLQATPRHDDKNAPVEFAVAVLDQAVFDLISGGKAYFDPYQGFYRLDGLDVRNYNLLLKLVGQQKFEKKGANPGGDGGADFKFRDVSKFVAYWNPSLRADATGKAGFEFTVPDNLTGWQILAMAVTPTEKAGLGLGEFKVNRMTEIRPVMPNQLLEGDTFSAGFSVMNRTDKSRRIEVDIVAEGDIDKTAHPASIKKSVELEPFSRTTIFLPLQAGQIDMTRERQIGEIGFKIVAGDAIDKDAFLYAVPVGKHIDLVSASSYGTSDKDDVSTAIAVPDGIRTDAGAIEVTLSPTVVTDVASAFRYMAAYPFLCWEQRLSKGVMAANFAALRDYLPDVLQWKEAPATLKSMVESAVDYQAPNGGMSYWVATNDRVDPYLSAYTALAFGWLRDRGEEPPQVVDEKLQAYLMDLLRKDTAPEFYSKNMLASVRAVTLAALSKQGRVTPRDIERLRPHFKTMGLFGNAMLLQASLMIDGIEGKDLSREFSDFLLAHSNQTSGKFFFSEERGEGYARILSTPLRDNCAILSGLSAYARKQDEKARMGDIAFKLARSISQSQRQEGYWGNTQENMFCTNALADYASAFESNAPDMTVTARLDTDVIGSARFEAVTSAPVTIAHPIADGDAGRKATVSLTRDGQGRYYYATRLSFSPLDGVTEPVNSGIEVRREYSVERDGKHVLLKPSDEIKRGELVRVDLYLSLAAPRNFVVVNDPVPGGLEPVNRDLATSSNVDAAKGEIELPEGSWGEKYKHWIEYASGYWSFYHRELRDDSVRFYSDYLGAGNYHLTYVAQAIATGAFSVRATKSEEMYDPDVFGYSAAGQLSVVE